MKPIRGNGGDGPNWFFAVFSGIVLSDKPKTLVGVFGLISTWKRRCSGGKAVDDVADGFRWVGGAASGPFPRGNIISDNYVLYYACCAPMEVTLKECLADVPQVPRCVHWNRSMPSGLGGLWRSQGD
jgi:hypothetical protein